MSGLSGKTAGTREKGTGKGNGNSNCAHRRDAEDAEDGEKTEYRMQYTGNGGTANDNGGFTAETRGGGGVCSIVLPGHYSMDVKSYS